MLETFIMVIHVLVAFFMILVVLVQGGNSGGVSATLGGGGGSSSGVFGATGATTILGKMTYVAAIIFMITSLSLSLMKSKSGSTGLTEKLATPGAAATEQPEKNAKPATVPPKAEEKK